MSYQNRPILNTILREELIDFVLEHFYDEIKERISKEGDLKL